MLQGPEVLPISRFGARIGGGECDQYGVERTWSNFRGVTSAITPEDLARYESLFYCLIT